MVTKESNTEARMAAAQDGTGSRARWAIIIVSFCLVAILIFASALTRQYWILGIFFSSALGLVAGIACHEFGHMLCAALLSLPIHVISIGSGPLLWRGRIGETRLELHAVPSSGCVRLYPQPVIRKFSALLCVLGGVLGNAALIGLVAVVDEARLVPPWGRDYLGPIVVIQCFLILENLVPFWTTVGGVRIGSDGFQLLQLAVGPYRGPTPAGLLYAAMLDRYGDANRVPPRRACARLIHLLAFSDRWTDTEARRDFQDALQRELNRGTLRKPCWRSMR